MMRITLLLFAVLFVFLACGCAGMASSQDYIYEQSFCSMTPPKQHAKIIFFRRSVFEGSALSFFVYENNTPVGVLSNGSHFCLLVAPGEHVYSTSCGEDVYHAKVSAKQGKTYSVECRVEAGMITPSPRLTKATNEDGEYAAGTTKMTRLIK